jgi:hypothetical protein
MNGRMMKKCGLSFKGCSRILVHRIHLHGKMIHYGTMIRDQILLKNSKCLESLQIERELRPRRYKPNATHLGSNRCREREISHSVQNDKQRKKRGADCTICTNADVEGHMTCGRQLFAQLVGDMSCLQ